ncbi:site-specific integrase [Magnetospirillum sp. 64-120]|uniref:tyrosine-type recombinase/integrase n=1 Tax=Magnetospirillum sp. 64-120 TaxID=1895778 RepID=UPI00092A0B5E|nr:site-specific integrase [Magnetospirillum sp. 64-120]OJX67174.1 MAG: hypothetical protein BGO92_01200 [Magnetospirillum sp. 64-120]
MARTVRNAKLDTRSARTKLDARREPYWFVISRGCALGYRKGTDGGTWIARYRDDNGKQHYRSLGAADDAMDSDGGGLCLTCAEAQRYADQWFKLAARGFEDDAPRSGPYTVKDALADYLDAYKRGHTAKGTGRAANRVQWTIDALINPSLGNVQVLKLTRRRIEQWHAGLANTAPRLRTGLGKPQKFREMDDSPDSIRRRHSSANRVLTVLKAALNLAFHDRKVASDDAWRSVKPFRDADAARVRYLNDDEARRVVNACTPDFRPLVQAALLTGCRYGELVALTVADYNADAGTVHIRMSKSGKPRHVALTNEGRKFFDTATAGKTGNSPMFTKADGSRWGASHQQRPFKAACEKAKVDAMTFHELRHSYASRLIMGEKDKTDPEGKRWLRPPVPLVVVAAQLGHTDTRMAEKHYGHLAPSYVADTVRAAFGTLGVVEETNVALFRK